MNSEIRAFVTMLNGMTVIGYVVGEGDTHYNLENALWLNMQQGERGLQVGFAPLTVVSDEDYTKGSTFTLQKSHVFMAHSVNEQLRNSYAQAVGKIVIAQSSILTSK